MVEEIRARIIAQKRRPSDFAILFRTNEQPRSFEMELRRPSSPTCWSAECRSTTARKSAMSWHISSCW